VKNGAYGFWYFVNGGSSLILALTGVLGGRAGR